MFITYLYLVFILSLKKNCLGLGIDRLRMENIDKLRIDKLRIVKLRVDKLKVNILKINRLTDKLRKNR